MHIEQVLTENVRHLEDRGWDFAAGPGLLRKWSWFPAGASATALLRCLALSGLGTRPMSLRSFPAGFARNSGRAFQVEYVQVRHVPECSVTSPARRHFGWRIFAGQATPLERGAAKLRDAVARFGVPESGRSTSARLLLGYGRRVQAHAGTDDFDIYPDQRVKRCAGLFEADARCTDPVAFLERVYHKSRFRQGRLRALLTRLSTELNPWLGWDIRAALERHEFATRWNATAMARRLPVAVILDMTRHAYDVAIPPFELDPLQRAGVALFDRPEDWCGAGKLAEVLAMMDRLLPRLQYVLALGPQAVRRFPAVLRDRVMPLPLPIGKTRKPALRPLRRGTVLLIDVDGTLPNLALMKLSRHFKGQRTPVALVRGVRALPPAETVLASCVFHQPATSRRLELLRDRYNGALQVGGSGVDLALRLAPEIEALPPDYSLYPELGDRALGFLTRGCPQRCPFCVVPTKEGSPRQVSDFDSLLQGRKQLILLDDNLLAHPAALEFLEEMVRRDLAVNFNQTLDLRRLTPEAAALLRRIRCANVSFSRRNYYFSLNHARQKERLRAAYALLQPTRADNIEFVCMYGCDTTLAEDVERFRFLRALPRAYVFVQRYQPVPGSPPPKLDHFFDERADALIDELIRIVYLQNMKSMETYYRWVALLYARMCGRIHHDLVSTLFRYNGRARMGGFLERLETLCAQ